MDGHLGYEKSERSDNDDYRNGYKSKTVKSSIGEMCIMYEGRLPTELTERTSQFRKNQHLYSVLQMFFSKFCKVISLLLILSATNNAVTIGIAVPALLVSR